MPPRKRKSPRAKANKGMDIQKYLDKFNKELNDGDTVVIETIDEATGESVKEVTVKKTLNVKPNDEVEKSTNAENSDEAPPEGTYFVDEDGQFYFQPASESVFHVVKGENQEKEILPDTPAAESNNEEELSYVYVVAEESVEEEGVNESNIAVYDFDEEEQPTPIQPAELTDHEDDKSKVKTKVKIEGGKASRKMYPCPHCDYSNGKKFLLSRHLKIHNGEKPHKCAVCSKGFRSQVGLSNHENTHTGTRPYKCEKCTSAFSTTGELTRHVRYRHTNERPHKCTECDYAAVEYGKLKRHFRCHTGERPYQCPHCTYASPDTFKLKRHLRIHTGERPYECEICQASFSQSNSLKAHRLTHFPDKRPTYQCSLCPAKSARKADLRGHIRLLHTATDPIECKKCGKMLQDRYTYKLHVRTHAGEKSYKCNICPYASVSKLHLSTHMLVHTDEKPFACDICDLKFRNKQLVKRHCNLYHNPNYVAPRAKPKNHECHECGNRFIHKGNLIRHLALHDPDSKVHEENLALKIGRKQKIMQQVNVMDATEIYLQNDTNDDDSQFEVYEMIQVEENGQETVRILNPTDEFGEKKIVVKNDPKADMENCFGFDEDEDDGNQVVLENENNDEDDSD